MYSERVSSIQVARACDELKVEVEPKEIGECQDICDHLVKWWANGQPIRPLQQWERNFIRSEQILCRWDFRYLAPRYVTIALDGGGVGKLEFAASQQIALDKYLGPAEEMNFELLEQGISPAMIDGLLFYWHKARQMYATAMTRALLMQRHAFSENFRALACSVDDDKIMELYDRDKLIWDNLPFYLKPKAMRDKDYDVKSEHLYSGALNNRILYQTSTQKSGVGQGRQFDGHHLTECAFFVNPTFDIDYVLNPAIPKSPWTIGIRESTANFRGDWWYMTTENARNKLDPRWKYIFMPWYILETKYAMRAPDSWRPNESTLRHADLVLKTSPEWTGGRTVHLTREQMHWYELNRDDYHRKGILNKFLTNYCATPDESFQHLESSAFPAELMEQLRLRADYSAVPYEVRIEL